MILDGALEGHAVVGLDPAGGVPDIDVALGVRELVEVGRAIHTLPGGQELCGRSRQGDPLTDFADMLGGGLSQPSGRPLLVAGFMLQILLVSDGQVLYRALPGMSILPVGKTG